jgi:hypothetical protein
MSKALAVAYNKVKKQLTGCCFQTADFSNVTGTPFAETTEHLPLFRYHAPVVDSTAPRLAKIFDMVCERLKVPRPFVHGFIVPSAEIGACCRQDVAGHAAIVLNSGLVERFSDGELSQVIGHELGHFLLPLKHDRQDSGRPASWEDARYSRHAEIAMDRIGLFASRDLSAACKMLLKIHVGLRETEFNYDVDAFLESTASGCAAEAGEIDACGEHPHLALRLRALILFSQSDYYLKVTGATGGIPIADVNAVISGELAQAVDDFVDSEVAKALEGVSSCLYAFIIVVEANDCVPKLAKVGLAPNLEMAKDMAKRWVSLPEEEWLDAYRSEMSIQLQAAVLRCPRLLNQYFEALRIEFSDSKMQPMLEEVTNVFNRSVAAMRAQ